MVWQKKQSFCEETKVAINSRSPGDSVLDPRSKTSASSLSGFAVSGRKTMGPRIPGNPSGNEIWGIAPRQLLLVSLVVKALPRNNQKLLIASYYCLRLAA